MSDDIPAAKKGGRPRKLPSERLTEPMSVQFTKSDYDSLCHVARLKRYEFLRVMIREWVLERLGAEIARSRGFETLKSTGSGRIM